MITRTEAIEAKTQKGRARGLSSRPYQECGINWLSIIGRCILADDMGLGKTKQSIEAVKLKNAKNVLIICPKSAINVWKDEIIKWKGQPPNVLRGNSKEKKEYLNKADSGWHISTYGSLEELKNTAGRFDVLIFDEAHKLKNPKANRSKFAYDLQRRAESVFMLTGTPIMNNPSEIWSLLHILYPATFTSFWQFVKTYCVLYFDGYREQILGVKDEEKYKRLIEPIVLRRLRDDCLDLPPIQRQIIPIDMEEDHRGVYSEIAHFEMKGLSRTQIYLERRKRITRLRQVSLSPKSIGYNVVGSKLKAAKDIIDGTDKKVVVFSFFLGPLRELMEMIDRPCDIFHGGLTLGQRETVSNKLNNGEIDVLCATITSAGESIPLTGASVVILLDRDWNPSTNDQAEARVYRPGQKNKVHVYILELQDSIDVDISRMIKRKSKTINSLINSLKTSHKRYLD